MTATIAAAVVAFDDSAVLDQCLRTLREAFVGPVIVVDNHSADDTATVAERLSQELDDVRVIRSDVNGGYAAGVNLARDSVDTTYLAVMNADCVVSGDWITQCVAVMESSDAIGACSPTVVLRGDSGINAEGLTLHVAGFGFNRNLGLPVSEVATEPGSVQGVQGTAFVIRTAALDRIGGWYSGGFLYHEDVELSWALRGAGYDIWHVPTPFVVHDYHLTMSVEKFFLLERNRLEMLLHHLRLSTRIVISPVIFATECAVWAYAISKRSGLVGAKWRSYRSVMDRRVLRRGRRHAIRSFRTVTDRNLLKHTQLRYPRSQTGKLFADDPTSGRRGDRELPTE
jgi:GT2 family glycosyltransferase